MRRSPSPLTTALARLLVISGSLWPLAARAGYTHYWTWHSAPSAESLAKCAEEQRRLVAFRASLLHVDDAPLPEVAGPDGGPSALGPTLISFNGLGDDGHEPFLWPGSLGFNFCKTDGKPYDEVVTAVLIAARNCFGRDQLAINSDGEWSDWAPGAALYETVLGHPADDPLGGDASIPEEKEAPKSPRAASSKTLIAIPLLVLAAFVALYNWDRRRPRRID